jgi:DNA-binding MarR family transcriptional regulator
MKKQDENETPPLPARFGQQLGIASQLYSGLIARLLEPHDLTYPQFMLLVHLARQGQPRRISDMARTVDLTQSAVTKAVQKFRALGWVEIGQDDRDGRNKPVRLTSLGQSQLVAVQRSFGPVFAEVLEGWDAGSLERLIHDLGILSEKLQRMRRT